MAVNLKKGQSVSLEKTASDIGITDLKNVSIALGWDITTKSSFDADLDVWALELGDFVPKRENLVYFGNKKSSDKMITHLGDNLTGRGEGDDETIICWLSSLPATVKYVVIGVTIYKGVMRHQAFSDVDNAFIRLYTYNNEREVELLRYTDKFNAIGREFTSMIFGVLERTPTGWKFNASGEPSTIKEIPEALNVYKQYTLNKAADKPNKNGGTKHMAVSLSKGGKVSLAKAASDAGVSVLKKVGVGLGWDVNRYDGGADFDLDASAFLTKGDGKVATDSNFIFYNNKDAAGVHHTGDNRTGDGEGDDELIEITLDQVAPDVEQINFTVTIHEADSRHQNFGMVERAYIRVFDLETGTELIRYDLGEDFSIETAIVVGQLYRHGGEWKFNAIGSGFSGGLAALCQNFGVNI